MAFMMRKKEFFGIASVALICLILLAFYQKEPSSVIRTKQSIAFQSIQFESIDEVPLEHISYDEIIGRQRLKIKRELFGYQLPSNRPLSDLVLETGGQPIRTLIVTTWRSGSTFLGDIINALPGTFYHYEPLLDYGIIQIRGPPHGESALAVFRSLLNCNYTNLHRYLEFGRAHNYLFTHNPRLWNQCELYEDVCWDPNFLHRFCSIFPFQSLKTVRLRLKLIEDLLVDKSLNVKVIYLVRDPRGTLQSRKHRDWCPGVPDCEQPSYLCSDMVSDYSAAIRLKQSYPHRFRAIRYEDLSLDPYQGTKEIFKFIGLNVHSQVTNFLDSHTTLTVGGVSSTFRDSKTIPFRWRTALNYTDIEYIEDNCREAMRLWGYIKTTGPDVKDFFPLGEYEIN